MVALFDEPLWKLKQSARVWLYVCVCVCVCVCVWQACVCVCVCVCEHHGDAWINDTILWAHFFFYINYS